MIGLFLPSLPTLAQPIDAGLDDDNVTRDQDQLGFSSALPQPLKLPSLMSNIIQIRCVLHPLLILHLLVYHFDPSRQSSHVCS